MLQGDGRRVNDVRCHLLVKWTCQAVGASKEGERVLVWHGCTVGLPNENMSISEEFIQLTHKELSDRIAKTHQNVNTHVLCRGEIFPRR